MVITGDTGSGKSTQLAQMLHAAGLGRGGQIAITQPRRVGAVSVSRRVAQEMGVTLGQEVGYTIRFEDCSSPRTRIRFFTDGCLLRDALVHKNLEPYRSVLIFVNLFFVREACLCFLIVVCVSDFFELSVW